MKTYNSIYLGICINNNDPDKRGRVQVFIPQIMPALYEGWNAAGQDIEITCVGDNIPQGLTSDVVDRLRKILPWAEAASPIVGTSAPGNVISRAVNAVAGAVGAAAGAVAGAASEAAQQVGNFLDQSPVGEPPNIQDMQSLIDEAKKYAGNDARGQEVKASYTTNRGPGNCLRGSQGILGALTGHPRFNAGKAGGLGESARLYSSAGGQNFTGTGLFNPPQSMPANYFGDPSQWRVGDVVANAGGNKGYGHIQVWTGKAWVSDFTQNRILQYDNYHSFALHRPNAAGEARITERLSGMSGMTGDSSTAIKERPSISGDSPSAPVQSQPTPANLQAGGGSSEQYGNAANQNIKINLETTPQQVGAFSDAGIDAIFKSEARLDSSGNLRVYPLPANDGGGSYEIAGINDRFHGPQAAKLKSLIESGQQQAAKDYAKAHIKTYTNPAASLAANAGSDYALRDIYFNRGPGGCYWMSKRAAGIEPNMKMNSDARQTILEAQKRDPKGYLQRLRAASEEYEATKVGYRKDFAAGLTKRWNDRLTTSIALVDGKVPEASPASLDSSEPFLTSPAAATADASSPSIPSTNVVQNTDSHGPVATQNLNGVAKGLFTYPAAGAMLWCFFREGNPLFPVYFAASYSQSEWSSVYKTGSPGPGYNPVPAPGEAMSTGGMMNLNGVGGIRWEDTHNPDNRSQDQKSIMFFGEDGSNIFLGKGYNQYYTRFDRRDQVEGDRWNTTLGTKEEWIQGDNNSVTMGDVFIKVGNVSSTALSAVEKINEIIKEIQKPLLEDSQEGSPSNQTTTSAQVSAANAVKQEEKTQQKQRGQALSDARNQQIKETGSLGSLTKGGRADATTAALKGQPRVQGSITRGGRADAATAARNRQNSTPPKA